MTWKREVTSHEDIHHGTIENTGYDWDQAADPDIEPKRPFRIYLPETGDEVRDALQDALRLMIRPKIRSKGHSSNNLVLEERGSVIWTEFLRTPLRSGSAEERSYEVDGGYVNLYAGDVLAEVDAALGERQTPLGFPVIGDHNHITAGGFASVGGVSPGSNVHGLFIDNVEEFEWYEWDGRHRISKRPRGDDRDGIEDFYSVLGGTGQRGVIARLLCRVHEIDKKRTIYSNARQLTLDFEEFVEISSKRIRERGDDADREHHRAPLMERGLWFEFPMPKLGILKHGQYSSYYEFSRAPGWWKKLWNGLQHGVLHGIGVVAGWQYPLVDKVLQYLGVVGVLIPPRYASIKNIESFADRIIDTSVGDPHRMLIVFAPVDVYEALLVKLHKLCVRERETGGVSFFGLYVKGISSGYLALAGKALRREKAAVHARCSEADIDESVRGPLPLWKQLLGRLMGFIFNRKPPGMARGSHRPQAAGSPTDANGWCEILLYLGIPRGAMSEDRLKAIVKEIDQLCVPLGAMRYMHTRTSPVEAPDPGMVEEAEKIRAEHGNAAADEFLKDASWQLRPMIDPNARVAEALRPADGAAGKHAKG